MVASTAAPAIADPSTQSSLVDSPAATASIDRYIASGERARVLTDLTWKLCLGLLVLVALAWAFAVLPGAVKLF